MRHVCPAIAAVCLCAAILTAPARGADAEPLSPERIQRAIEKARDWLVREQEGDGSWECEMRTQDTRVGATALVMLALANAGV